MKKKIFYISIDDTFGMNAISLVTHPAVEYDFLKFDKDAPIKLDFDEDKHIITGVVCLADTPIYRYSEGLGEWWCVFTKDVIQQMMVKYSKDNLWNSINLQHNDDKFVNSVIMMESYIKDSNRGIAPKEFADVPDGSWLCSFKVESDELWDNIKNGSEFNGFSIQGFFDIVPKQEELESEERDLIDEVYDYLK